jgi:hypothetical protein
MNHNDTVELARNAKTITTNRAFNEAFNRYREKCIEQLQAADPLNVDLVLTLKRHLTSLSVVRKNLEAMIDDGIMAEQAINLERQTLAQRAKSAVRRVVNG